MKTFLQRTGLVLCVGVAIAAGDRVFAQLRPGDLLVTDSAIPGVYQIDSFTGAPTLISSGGSLQRPTGIALGPANEIYVVDTRGANDGSRVFRIDAQSGSQTLIADLLVDDAADIEVGANGNLYVAGSTYHRWSRRRVGTVTQIDPQTGIPGTFSGWGRFKAPTAIESGPNGVFYVIDNQYQGGAVVGLNPVTSGTWDIAYGGAFLGVQDLAVMYNGDIAVLDADAFGVWNPFRVSGGATFNVRPSRPPALSHTPTSHSGNFQQPRAMALTWFGHLMVADEGFIMRIDPGSPHGGVGANQAIVWITTYLLSPTGMDIVPGIRWDFPPRPLEPRPSPFG